MSLVIPGHLVFFFIIYFLNAESKLPQPVLTVWFVLFYLLAALIQVNSKSFFYILFELKNCFFLGDYSIRHLLLLSAFCLAI